MKTIKTVAVVSVLVFGMTTSVFASWWNPFSWGWFKNKDVSIAQTVPAQTTSKVAIILSKSIIKPLENFDILVKNLPVDNGIVWEVYFSSYKESWGKYPKATVTSLNPRATLDSPNISGQYYVWLVGKKLDNVISKTIVPITVISSTENKTEETNGWKTYTNTKFNYSIKYPSDFTIAFEPQNIPVSPNQNSSFTLVNFKLDWNYFKGLDPGQVMIKAEVYDSSVCSSTIEDPNKKETVIEGVKVTKYIQTGNDGGESTASYSYLFQKNGNCFLIKLMPYPTDKNIIQKFDQIMSTFKFNK